MKDRNVRLTIIWAFIISWTGITPSLLKSYNIYYPPVLDGLVILQYFGALIAALIFVYKDGGASGIKRLFSKFTKVKAAIWVILAVILLPWILSLLSTFIGFQLSDSVWPEKWTAQEVLGRFAAAIVLQLLLNTEEFVWRGVVFDSWLKKYGYLKACVVLAGVWWAFHMPMFLRNGGHEAGQELLPFSIMVISMTFVMGWLYKHTLGSLLYVHLFHQLLNSVSESLPLFPQLNGGIKAPYSVFIALTASLGLIAVLYEFKRRKVPMQ
ncbi:MAG: CPBP family intramembrane metalloprotease [Roseivirga sp.]|nr:CPBP family intramembrane metalloprotease [Roseivirga sp.]